MSEAVENQSHILWAPEHSSVISAQVKQLTVSALYCNIKIRITLIPTSYLTRWKIYMRLKHASCVVLRGSSTNLAGFVFIRTQQVTSPFPYVTAKSGCDFVTRKTSSKMSPSVWESIGQDVSPAQRFEALRHFTAERLNLLNFEWWPFDFCFYNFSSSWYLQVNGCLRWICCRMVFVRDC